tara:strand:+ start:494 stop:1249 length:756 start_codon:yes stop_codon:yes gene_type:complete
MKLLSKIFNSLITDLYKIDILRTTIVIIRFIFLFHIRKKIKYYIDPNKKIDDHIIVPREDGSKKTVITHNMRFIENFFDFRKTFRRFNGSKTKQISFPLMSIDYLNFERDKVLSVGPRNEGELFQIRSMGFKWQNIYGIDLLSYSNLVTLGDIHKSKYMDNFFNVILCGWVITYSTNYEKILDELLRIVKNKGIISIGFSYNPNEDSSIYSTEQILKRYEKNISQVYFNFDAYKDNPENRRHSILILKIKK